MNLLRWIGAALCALLAGCMGAGNPPAADAGLGPEVLVMFRDSVPPHFRPDGAGGGYGAPDSRSRVLARARALAGKHGLVVAGDWPMPSLGLYCVLVRPARDTALDTLLPRLEAEPGVAWAQAVQTFEVLNAKDPYYELQKGGPALHLDEMHRHATGRQVTVAQIDTGADVGHPDLVGRIAEAVNFVDGEAWRIEAHGTAVAGLIAGIGGNGIGIVGVAPEASLLALRACRESGSRAQCSTFALAKAMEFAFQRRARVLNLSLTGPKDRLLAALLDRFVAEGMIVVAAVDPSRPDGGFPAGHPGVVAAGTRAMAGAGPPVFVAPGDDVITTLPGGRWGYVTGDSFAAAHMSGLAALFTERDRRLTGPRFRAMFAEPARAAVNSCAMLMALTQARGCRCCEKAANTE